MMQRDQSHWLFYPFVYIAGIKALGLGLLFMGISVCIASLSSLHFDGVIDMHFSIVSNSVWKVYILEQCINLLIIVIVLSIPGFILNKASARFVDILGTQALARAPLLLATLPALAVSQADINALINPENIGQINDLLFTNAGLIAFLVVSVIATIWMVWLMYHSFSISFNLKGRVATISFIIALVVGEFLSKWAMSFI